MSSRHGDRRGRRRNRSRSPDFRHKERREERSRPSREEDERRHPHREAVEQNGRSRQSRKNEDKNRTEAGSPQRKRERRESHPQRNYEKSTDGQDNRNRRDQSNENSRVEREDFLGNSDRDPPQPKEEPNFELSGKLAEYTNTYKGVVIKYNEPPEALKPKTRWRLYPFKGDQAMSVLYIHRQSAYLIGRQRHIADLAVDHPSCSKQHAVLQYRLVNYEKPDGSAGRKCKPYIIDLESANGTFLNNQKIEARRYYELKEKDVLKFGFSSREYVLLNEKTKGSEIDDDIVSEEQPPADS